MASSKTEGGAGRPMSPNLLAPHDWDLLIPSIDDLTGYFPDPIEGNKRNSHEIVSLNKESLV